LYSVSKQRPGDIPARPPVEVRASAKRRSTVSASWEDGRIVVLVPSRLGTAERDKVVDELVQRLLRRAPMLHSDDRALEERTIKLADRYLDGVRANSVRWVGNQKKRWGSCCPSTGHIRVSNRLRPVPPWVLDAVLVHELAHLLEPNHSKRFRALASRYPRMDDADIFLHGFSTGLEAASDQSRSESSQEEDEYSPTDSAPDSEAGRTTDLQDVFRMDQARLFNVSALDEAAYMAPRTRK
jgi:predicted metal-dependent hydrolase